MKGVIQLLAEHNYLSYHIRRVIFCKGTVGVIVSYVKGHANEIDIAVGQATPKESDANGEADELAVGGAKKHAIPEDIK